MGRVTSIDPVHGEPHTFRVYYKDAMNNPSRMDVYAKDELDAFTQANKLIRTEDMNLRIFFLCVAGVLLAIILGLNYAATSSRAYYAAKSSPIWKLSTRRSPARSSTMTT